ncbi:isoleucine--tRNA ligase [Candidatus Laterigemmans baculatus]|uniref:isoleucine--tRNA ligase n=1 Tax=Candidatus Laterigemmans baculatus TaxID=2770505 RepID=UPI0013D9C0FB|nr:isoleucine--tRNA ligase [Candidatus Laterigemmans baculatus]
MFKAVSTNVNFPEQEEAVLRFWDQANVYQRSLDQRADAPPFVFFEGPPTANGLPHPGHCLTRAIKDLFPRYRTMRGYRCERKAGWDTHGLPVEVEVGKELGIHSKEEIEAYGVEPFIQRCQQSVWRYMREWEQLTRRIGFWVNLEEAYVTYHKSYIESVWWSLKNLFDRGLLYRGHKIVWWWAQGGTALSAGEVGQGYREVADPSVYVRLPLVDQPDRSLLVWTTTPWTLPSNMFAAVHPELEYSLCRDAETGDQFYVASALVESLAAKTRRDLQPLETCRGSELVGLRYQPPFDDFRTRLEDPSGRTLDGETLHHYWRVVAADFVTTDSGTGLVHQAPAFGEVDYEVFDRERARFVEGEQPSLFHAVGPDGKFTDEAPAVAGMWVKDADKPLIRSLKETGLLYHQEQYLHEYPFCWRADEDPLIQYPRESWFIRTTAFKQAMLENNSQINWLPAHIRDGRFGNFLESNVDWALSRERYWGTPLPVWECQATGRFEAIASYAELLAKPGLRGTEVWEQAKAANPELADDLCVHKPYIDAVEYDSPFADGARMRRVPEVIDCWYDSGSMPFAQWGWPHQNAEHFESQFPADFISEALDQTRGWFYSQLAISTMLFGEAAGRTADPETALQEATQPSQNAEAGAISYPHPFRNCIVLGLMLGEDNTKMSKSKRNYREPREIFDKYGADALRWFFFAGQPPWTQIRYREQAIRDSIPEFLLRLWNVFSFFTIYAEIDRFDCTAGIGDPGDLKPERLASAATYRPASERSEIDRWILSELARTVGTVVERMDAYDNYAACAAITELVDGLSNWFVRRSRDRFWASDRNDPDKLDAYWTLYEVLLETSKLIAPFVPFLAETLWQNLTAPFRGADAEATASSVPDSVHLCDYPEPSTANLDADLSTAMHVLREIASLGRAARASAKLKVRQPLARVEVVLADDTHTEWLRRHDNLVREELNVKAVDYTTDGREYVQYDVVPNFKRLGPRVGRHMPAVKKALAAADGGRLLVELQRDSKIELDVDGEVFELDGEDVEVRLSARPGWAAAQGRDSVVVLSTEVTEELRREGIAKDLIRTIQNRRKELGCEFTDRIEVAVVGDSEEVRAAVEEHRERIVNETLADLLEYEPIAETEPLTASLGDDDVQLYIRVVCTPTRP